MSKLMTRIVKGLPCKVYQISLAETIIRLNMIADFIQENATFLKKNESLFTQEDRFITKEGVLTSSVLGWAAHDPAFNAKGLWMARKVSTDSKDFKSNFVLTFAPSAKTQEEADVYSDKSSNRYFTVTSFFGIEPRVFNFLFACTNYEHAFTIQKYTIQHWLKQMQIPEVYWSTLDFEPKSSFIRVSPADMVKRIRAFANVLEHSPLADTFEATCELFEMFEHELEDKAKQEAKKARRELQKHSILNFIGTFARTVFP